MKIKFILSFFIVVRMLSFGQLPYHEARAIIDEDKSKDILCTNTSTSFINKYHDKYNEDLSFWKPKINAIVKTHI